MNRADQDRHHGWRRWAGCILAASLVLAVGCSDDSGAKSTMTDKTPKTPKTTTSTTPTTQDPEALKREMVSIHQEWRRNFREMYKEPDPASPLLDELFVDGETKDRIRSRLADIQGRNDRPEQRDTVKAIGIQVEAGSVLLTECGLSVVGEQSAAPTLVSSEVQLRFVKTGDVWRVSEINQISMDQGKVGCAQGIE